MACSFKDNMVKLIPKLRAYATSLTGSVDDADDLVQEALTRAWKFREGYQPDTNFQAWMFKILRNEFLGQVKKARRPYLVARQSSARNVAHPEQEWRVFYAELLDNLGRLSAENRDALVLIAGAGMSYEEAAACCGCPVGTLKSRVNRARLQMADLIERDLPPWVRAPGSDAARGGPAVLADGSGRARDAPDHASAALSARRAAPGSGRSGIPVGLTDYGGVCGAAVAAA